MGRIGRASFELIMGTPGSEIVTVNDIVSIEVDYCGGSKYRF